MSYGLTVIDCQTCGPALLACALRWATLNGAKVILMGDPAGNVPLSRGAVEALARASRVADKPQDCKISDYVAGLVAGIEGVELSGGVRGVLEDMLPDSIKSFMSKGQKESARGYVCVTTDPEAPAGGQAGDGGTWVRTASELPKAAPEADDFMKLASMLFQGSKKMSASVKNGNGGGGAAAM